MKQHTTWPVVSKIMVAGIAPFAALVALDLLILATTRMFFPGTAGGGDALLMALLPILGYLLACILLVPCLAYLAFQRFRRGRHPPVHQRRLIWAALMVIAGPPLVINLVPLLLRV